MKEIILFEDSLFNEVKEIFFLSTSIKSFSSEEKKEAFFKRWCQDYIIHYPQQFYIMRDSESKKVLGYLSGCDNSTESLAKLEVPGHACFSDLFGMFPAHLHINFHPDCRGQGLGSKLIEHYSLLLRKNNIQGLHLVTSPDANNVSFYRRLNFSYEEARVLGKMHQLFMGLKLC
jgi:ribosomal protein S18 acetylase RimI-like enzyme